MDLVYGRVANEWIILAWVIGISRQVQSLGIWGVPAFAAGAVVPIAVLYGLFLFRMLGAGDIKLLSALGGLMGAGSVWKCIICSIILGAMISLAILLSCKNLQERIHYFIQYMCDYMRTGRRTPYILKGNRMENYPFTVSVLFAVMLYTGGFY